MSTSEKTPEPIIDIATPINWKLSGMFKRSFAYFTVKERLPIIVTKIIDQLARDREEIIHQYGPKSEIDVRTTMSYLVRLRSEIMTNKPFELICSDASDALLWNSLIREHNGPTYFTSIWLFTECYFYRRIREAFELTCELKHFDPFRKQKDQQFVGSIEAMCHVADQMVTTWLTITRDETNLSYYLLNLLKVCLWSNKCDLSLSVGADVAQKFNPILGIPLWDKNIIINEFDKLFTFLCKACGLMQRCEVVSAAAPKDDKPIATVANNHSEELRYESANHTILSGIETLKAEDQLKFKRPESQAIIDIVCDNAGYELFTDLCLADFLITKGFCKKVRFRLKAMPWFVSDVTMRDFHWTIEACYSIGEAGSDLDIDSCDLDVKAKQARALAAKHLKSDNLVELGTRWKKYIADGHFEPVVDEFWTTPYDYSQMRRVDPFLYKSLSDADFVFFKGDLNYRKLMGENNWNPTTSFRKALQGFHPAPICAIRTVKADLISGLKDGQMADLIAKDENWMATGEYGLIQTCNKISQISPEELDSDPDDV